MLAFVAYIIAAVFFAVCALEGTLTGHSLEWGFFFVALGLVLDHLPAGWPRRP